MDNSIFSKINDTTKHYGKHRISIAPMMNWTDRHCRMFHRQITRHTWLYTEMVTTNALLHGNVERYLKFNEEEHPIVLQLGGNQPFDLAISAKLGEKWGYDEINLNCGCPSKHVQYGAFGACLMAKPMLVADCIKAMRDAVSVNITIKHRIGLNKITSYDFMRDFVGILSEAGCNTFIIHARNAILNGMNSKKNREIPILKYDVVYRLKRDFSNLEIILNGGIKTIAEIDTHLNYVDGVMLGRKVYHDPFFMTNFDTRYYPELVKYPSVCRKNIFSKMIIYAYSQLKYYNDINKNIQLKNIIRHMAGLVTGIPKGRTFRRILLNSTQSTLNYDLPLLIKILSHV